MPTTASTFDGGLSMELFDGTVAVSSLAMERPFGVAPTLSADIAIDDLDLQSLTERVRLRQHHRARWTGASTDCAWWTGSRSPSTRRCTPTASAACASASASARCRTCRSVGDAVASSTSLQAQLIGLFDDFGYARIGIACRLRDEVCAMDGLGSAGIHAEPALLSSQGSGLPRLTVVGFNRRVDWPTLVERLVAVGTGEVKPVVE